VRQLMALAGESGFTSLIARIVGENASSIRLHEKCGFTLVGTEIEVGRKQGVWLDVVEFSTLCRLAHARQRTRELRLLAGQDHCVQRPSGMIKTPPRIATATAIRSGLECTRSAIALFLRRPMNGP